MSHRQKFDQIVPRVPRGTSPAEALKNLTTRQQRLIASVVASREAEPLAARKAAEKTFRATARAMQAGVPAVVLAEALGVSRARVYQMRDEADQSTRSH